MRNIKYLAYHLIFLALVYIVYALITGHNIDPGEANLMNWDVTHYNSIRTIGYYFTPYFESNVAFFPGFPYLWKFLGLNAYGISLLNIALFYFSLLLLAHFFEFKPKEILLALSIPSMMFMYVPYSEALFFFTSTFLLIGLKKDQRWLIMLALFACSLTRSAANVFLPAIVILNILGSSRHNRWVNILLYSFSSLAGIFLVSFIQHAQTGSWFGFIQTQKHWHHELGLPELPFRTWWDVIRLDGSALFTGLIAITTVTYFFWRWLKTKAEYTDRPLLFAVLYVAGVTMLALLFKNGSLYSLNRYVYPTAFFVLFLAYFVRRSVFTTKQYLYILAAIAIFTIVVINGTLDPVKIYGHIQSFAKFFGFILYLFSFFLIYHKSAPLRNIAFGVAYFAGVIIQIYFLFRFIDCIWVG